MGDRLTETFFQLFTEKNTNCTRTLRLHGKELFERIGKRLVAADMVKVCNYLKTTPKIINLTLCYNNIGDKGFKILIDEYLSSENALEILNVQGCDLTAKAIEKLYESRMTIRLKTLRLSCNPGLGVNSGRHLAMLIESSTTLEYLDIGDTNQTIFSINGILSRLTFSSIKVLDLSRVLPRNMYSGPDSTELALSLSWLLEYNNNLEELHLQKCQMDGHDVEILVTSLYRNKSLLLLDLGYNKFGDHGMEHIGKWIQTAPKLLGLVASGNGVKDYGGQIISTCLPFSKVRYLDISYNNITDFGMRHVLNSLKKPYQIRIFYFWGNPFGVQTNRTLKRTLLSGVLKQEYIDVKLYSVDKELKAAYYPTNRNKNRYYTVMDRGSAFELKICSNFVPPESAKPRALVDFKHMDRFPPLRREDFVKRVVNYDSVNEEEEECNMEVLIAEDEEESDSDSSDH